MKYRFLVFLLFLTRLASAAPAPYVDLPAALHAGRVKLTAQALHGLGNGTLRCVLHNPGPLPLRLRVPPGLHFVAADVGAQDLFTFQEQLLVLKPGTRDTLHLWGFCIEKHDYSPPANTVYTCAGRAGKGLAALGDSLQKYPGLADSYGQQFAWHLSDAAPLPAEIIVLPALLRGATNTVRYLVSVSGQPASKIVSIAPPASASTPRKAGSVPAAPPVRVAPRFKMFSRRVPLLYHSPTAQLASLQVCDAQGRRLYDQFASRQLKPGVLSYTFGLNESVDLRAHPVYLVRLLGAQGQVLKEISVDETTPLPDDEPLHQRFATEFKLLKTVKDARFRVRLLDGTLVEETDRKPYLPAGQFRYSSVFSHLQPAGTAFTIAVETAAGEVLSKQPVVAPK